MTSDLSLTSPWRAITRSPSFAADLSEIVLKYINPTPTKYQNVMATTLWWTKHVLLVVLVELGVLSSTPVLPIILTQGFGLREALTGSGLTNGGHSRCSEIANILPLVKV